VHRSTNARATRPWCQPLKSEQVRRRGIGASGTAEDVAGNTSALAAVSGMSIDTTPPVITINGLTQATYVLGNPPSVSCSAPTPPQGWRGRAPAPLSGGSANGVGTFTYKSDPSMEHGTGR
jgi:hypothetical protein